VFLLDTQAIAIEHTDELHSRFSAIARGNLAAVERFVERTGSLFTWQRPKAGLVVWLDYHGPGNAQELAKSVMENEFILVVRSRLKLR
jgi:DNA-binding transcriptional MocR family regulator